MIRYLINFVSKAVPILPWPAFTLSGRSQKTQFRGTLTEALPVSVSQGNILGPLFFIIRISDSPLDRPSGVNSTMFADDTTILIQVPSITNVSTQLNEVASTAST